MKKIEGMETQELLTLAKKNMVIASLIDLISTHHEFLRDNNINFTTAGIQVRVHPDVD